MLGDNGQIVRLVDAAGLWLRHTGGIFDLAKRETTVTQAPEQAGAFGNDYMQGNTGHDDMYGQQGHDYLEGNNDQDAMIGDLGKITNRVEDGSRQRTIVTNPPFFSEVIFAAGRFTRQVQLYAFLTSAGAAGNDVMLGGDDRDSIHGAAGHDFINGDGDGVDGSDPVPGTDDEDHIFGGDDNDVMWGGRGHDHLWGGYQDDHLDVRPRVAAEVTAPDTPEWFTYGEPDHYQGLDIIYGGWGQDALQANVTIPGPPDADRLIDWDGGYNVFYVCPGAYGEGTITRLGSPDLLLFLRNLADADGAHLPFTTGSSGFRELAYVFNNERGQNSHPPHPDHPGHFICDATRSVQEVGTCLVPCPFPPCNSGPDPLPEIPAAAVTTALSRTSNAVAPGGWCDHPLLPARQSEPSEAGITEVRIGFDLPPGPPSDAGVVLEQATCAEPTFVPYSGASATWGSVGGNELVLTFSPALENGRTYRIHIGPELASLEGQFVEIRGLVGDVNGDGQVSSVDRAVVVGAWTSPSGFTCATDLDGSGQTNGIDRAIVVGAWTARSNCAP